MQHAQIGDARARVGVEPRVVVNAVGDDRLVLAADVVVADRDLNGRIERVVAAMARREDVAGAATDLDDRAGARILRDGRSPLYLER